MINFPSQRTPAQGALDQNTPVTWRVTAQAEGVAPNAAGQLVSGVRVYFTLSNGLAASVFVPHDAYTVANVQAAIQERVDTITGVGSLGGSTTSPSGA